MSKKIGWQKYEDMLKKQISSPLASIMMSSQLDLVEEEDYLEEDVFEEEIESQEIMAVPVPNSFYEQISLITNYDCWLGHSNFDLTPSIKSEIEKVEGVEVLKICSRYRFFLGIGQMFKFTDVRKNIEEIIN
jgi:hypothetical protein|tara:strand:+ start:60 stop:455 length:396 start_codon:yes stop_codon:yes gene_type:complete